MDESEANFVDFELLMLRVVNINCKNTKEFYVERQALSMQQFAHAKSLQAAISFNETLSKGKLQSAILKLT